MGYVWSFDGEQILNVESAPRSGPQAASKEWTYPGVDGVDSVHHGFRGETITLQCWGVTQTPEADVEAFRSKAKSGTVGRLTSTRPGFTDLDYCKIVNVQQGRLIGGDDGFWLVEYTLTIRQIKDND